MISAIRIFSTITASRLINYLMTLAHIHVAERVYNGLGDDFKQVVRFFTQLTDEKPIKQRIFW